MKLVHVCAVLVVLEVLANLVASQPEKYWDYVLPNVPMPDAIKEFIRPEEQDSKVSPRTIVDGAGKRDVAISAGYADGSTNVSVGKGGVGVSSGYNGGSTNVGVGKGGVGVSTNYEGGSTNVGVGKGGVGVNASYPGGGTTVGVRKGGVGVAVGSTGEGNKRKPIYVAVEPFGLPFTYKYAATDTQLNNDPDVTLFFEGKDMRHGHSFDLHFSSSSDKEKLLPRAEADLIPFSSGMLPEIYRRFSVRPNSLEADTLKATLKDCEDSVAGEEKHCATSLESMIDFVVLKLGKRVHALSTYVRNSKKQNYMVVDVKIISTRKFIVCHKQPYAYVVFYCHTSEMTRAHLVSLRGADGTRAKALAVCHGNTATWNPKHVAFKILNVKPGTVPICHFLPEQHILWAQM